jgi:outer membrane lipoprotein carrier protein
MRIAVVLLTGLIASFSHAQSAVDALSQQLVKQQKLEAKFVQYVLDASGSRLQETHGEMILWAPNQFWWQTQDPFAQLIVSNGQRLWIYDKDLEQVTVQPVDNRTTSTPALLLSGNGQDIDKEFVVEMAQTEDGLTLYRLIPKDPESLYQSLRLNFKNDQLLEMQIQDTLFQKTSLIFSDVVVNPMIDESIFQFVVPKGVDLVEMGQF